MSRCRSRCRERGSGRVGEGAGKVSGSGVQLKPQNRVPVRNNFGILVSRTIFIALILVSF